MIRVAERAVVAMLLATAAVLAVTSALGDSVTVDETAHLPAGLAPLVTGDYRLSPEHPPLARMWAALPLLVLPHAWPPPDAPGWHEGDFLRFGKDWFSRWNDGDRLIRAARAMMIVLLLVLCATVAWTARRIFGRAAGSLALALAALDPGLLAHGHYVTTDLPLTLAALLSLVTFSRLLERLTLGRLAAACAALAAASVTKYSWPLLLPALALMTVVAAARREPLVLVAPAPRRAQPPIVAVRGRRARAAILAAVALAMLASVWLVVWATYGFRSSPFRGPDRETAMMHTVSDFGRPRPATMAEAWEVVLHDPVTAAPSAGPVAAAIRFARGRQLLPEAYLYGLAYAHKKAQFRSAFLMGEYSTTGWRSYFPIVFAIKTPLATQILLIAGLVAVATGRATVGGAPLLAAGLVAFTLTAASAALASHLNLGHRHLLPIYPGVFVLAGASAAWRASRAGRVLLGGALVWLASATLAAHPCYLGYFNELVGGSTRGHLYLADSNIDWGQDLLRLAAYARRHPEETIKLAQFGAVPLPRGFTPEILVSESPDERLAPLAAGTYVASVTELLGVYHPLVRDSAWERTAVRAQYEALAAAAGPAPPATATDTARATAARTLDVLRRARLLNRLRRRPPDERIGTSLFVYRLDQATVDALVRP